MLFQPKYSYKVRVINPSKKTDYVVRQIHPFHSKFVNVFQLRSTLVDELKEQVPDSTTFRVGYLEGLKNRMSVVSNDDIKAMYDSQGCDITLWCDARIEDSARSDTNLGKRRRDERESEVEEVFEELKRKHEEQYDVLGLYTYLTI